MPTGMLIPATSFADGGLLDRLSSALFWVALTGLEELLFFSVMNSVATSLLSAKFLRFGTDTPRNLWTGGMVSDAGHEDRQKLVNPFLETQIVLSVKA